MTVVAEAALLGLAKKMARFAIGGGAQREAGGQRFERVKDAHERFGWFETADINFLHVVHGAGRRCTSGDDRGRGPCG